ncbi:MFS transporter [Cereibacter changlensis]|uniref:MFS transporter n=2 Tax=Cereibacter changlensis TaxID=402884 RepID=A0A2T4K0Y1_9RHOB|nr:MFS transporter [Cereibacter changlensis]PTE23810.1 MFS transporter [Cereibacter changlensis JA139]PZX58977.1 MFS transporter [Cereibacter changlensis]
MPFFTFLRANAPFLFVGFLLSFLSSFGQTFFISTFGGEIRAEFGLSHGQWGAVYGIATTFSAAVMLWSGGLTDRFRVRALGPMVLGGLALTCVAMALNPFVMLLPVAIFALRLLGQGMTSHIAGVAMARWFVASRGRALAIAALGFSFGEALLPVAFVALKGVTGWRTLWLVAAAILLVSLPVLARLLRQERTPQSMAAEAQIGGMHGRHWSRNEVLRHRLFWFLVPALLGPSAFNTAFFFQQVHLAEVKGWAHVGLVAIFPAYSAASVVALLASGWAVDRFGTARLMPLFQLPLALFYFLFAGVDSLALALPVMLLMGLTSGAQATVPVAFWAEFYGTRHIGSIKATAAAIMVLGSAIGPILTGALIDLGISFPQQMVGIGLYFLLACLLAGIGVGTAKRSLTVSA